MTAVARLLEVVCPGSCDVSTVLTSVVKAYTAKSSCRQQLAVATQPMKIVAFCNVAAGTAHREAAI